MKIFTLVLFLTIAMLAVVWEASAMATPDEIAAADNVYISNVTYDPGSFLPGIPEQ